MSLTEKYKGTDVVAKTLQGLAAAFIEVAGDQAEENLALFVDGEVSAADVSMAIQRAQPKQGL